MPSTHIFTDKGIAWVEYIFKKEGGLVYQVDNAQDLGLPDGLTVLGSGFHCPDANSTDKGVLQDLLVEEIISLTLGD
jgi:hypothetical protein